MRGSKTVIVQNDRTKYEFVIRRNITIVRGDSATGKTTLIEMIRDYNLLGEDSGVEIICSCNCVVIEGLNWKEQLERIQKSIIFIDEANKFISSRQFAETIKKTDNYYVLVTREDLSTLPYSVEEIYGIRSKGKYGGLKQTFHEMYHMYSEKILTGKIHPTKIITEDSNSGYQFFKTVCDKKEIQCLTAHGKSNIAKMILREREGSIIIIADGAAFGSEMDRIMGVLQKNTNVYLFLPESFEWLLLVSDIIDDKDIRKMKDNWGDYIESQQYFSWEQFFTHVLIEKTQKTYLEYNKKKINSSYLHSGIYNKVLERIKLIDF